MGSEPWCPKYFFCRHKNFEWEVSLNVQNLSKKIFLKYSGQIENPHKILFTRFLGLNVRENGVVLNVGQEEYFGCGKCGFFLENVFWGKKIVGRKILNFFFCRKNISDVETWFFKKIFLKWNIWRRKKKFSNGKRVLNVRSIFCRQKKNIRTLAKQSEHGQLVWNKSHNNK